MAFEFVLLALVLLGLTIAIHYETLRFVSERLSTREGASRARLFVVLVAALASHLAHILLYAWSFMLFDLQEGFGTIEGSDGGFWDAFYFSITSYTTLGIGDLYPTQAIRFLSGIEALNGLVMVGWTASFTYLTMERFWALGRDQENDQ